MRLKLVVIASILFISTFSLESAYALSDSTLPAFLTHELYENELVLVYYVRAMRPMIEDWIQTHHVSGELNPIIGDDDQNFTIPWRVNTYFSICSLGLLFLGFVIPEPYNLFFLDSVAFTEELVVRQNNYLSEHPGATASYLPIGIRITILF